MFGFEVLKIRFKLLHCGFSPKTGLLNQLLPSKSNCLWTNGQVLTGNQSDFATILQTKIVVFIEKNFW